MKHFDYIIVGQGLAGTILTEHLLNKNKSVLVIDNNQNYSSSVAAGIINPIVFKRITKSWRADDLVPKLNQFYSEIEKKYAVSILEQIDMVKIFNSFEDQNNWLGKMQDINFSKYLSDEKKIAFAQENYIHQYGYGVVKKAARLDITTFLRSCKDNYSKQGYLLEESFVFKSLSIDEKGLQYKDISASKIIFCEGYKLKENPYFDYLNLINTKGEILDVSVDGYDVDYILNRGFFMYPKKDNTYTVGATYSWHDESLNTTEEAKNELLEKVSATLLNKKVEVVNHKTGIRPTTPDHKPLIGAHPEHKNMFVFNGLGTKGVMIAPYFAEQLANHLEENLSLDKEVDIKRFDK